MRRKGQVAIYIIIAIVLVVGVGLVFMLREDAGEQQISQELRPVFDYYSECIEKETRAAVNLAGAGGGRVFVSNYVPGSEYAPFSSHLNFLGSPVEYWYSIKGNGIIDENVPTLTEIEEEIGEYVKIGMKECDLGYYRQQGFEINAGEPRIEVNILERKVEVNVNAALNVRKGEESAERAEHSVEIDSKLGKFYNEATGIYQEQVRKAFLEEYAIDVLYNYAPVDGVELQCGPQIWKTREVTSSLRNGLAENFRTIKLEGNYYELSDKKREYFVYEYPTEEAVNVLYFEDWPSKIEIYGEGVDDELMVGEPVGTEAGMGAMGFCYIPYHFIYDVQFPVMIQLYDERELFQFPMVVIIDKNVPRKAAVGQAVVNQDEFELCEFMNEDLTINLYDMNINNVDGNVSFECFDQKCRLGETKNGVLRTPVPACVNGYVHVRAEGFADAKQTVSTNTQSFVEVIMEREHTLTVKMKVGGSELGEERAIVSFIRDDGKVATTVMPEQNEIELSEGNYEVRVYVYGNSSIKIPESTKTQCVEAPRKGLLGLLGSTKEECFEIKIPATTIDSALVGGGVLNTYLLESELSKGNLLISVERLPRPNSLEQLSDNFNIFETKRVGIGFEES